MPTWPPAQPPDLYANSERAGYADFERGNHPTSDQMLTVAFQATHAVHHMHCSAVRCPPATGPEGYFSTVSADGGPRVLEHLGIVLPTCPFDPATHGYLAQLTAQLTTISSIIPASSTSPLAVAPASTRPAARAPGPATAVFAPETTWIVRRPLASRPSVVVTPPFHPPPCCSPPVVDVREARPAPFSPVCAVAALEDRVPGLPEARGIPAQLHCDSPPP